MRLLKFFILNFLLPLTVHAQDLYFPDRDWVARNPADFNIDKSLLDSAIRVAIHSEINIDEDLRIANLKAFADEPGFRILGPMKHRGKPSGVVLRKGYIIGQWGDVQRVDMTFSVTKSFLSTVAGLAVDQKLIRSVNDKVSAYVWDGTFDGHHNSQVTWLHLLNQTSDWSGCLFDICDWADRPPRDGTLDDWKNRKLVEPGTVFEYNDVRVNLLAYSLLQVLRKPLPEILREKIMDPIGASTTWRWYGYDNSFVNMDGVMIQSVSGGGHFGGGLFINTIDMARFGLLFQRGGKWKDRQLISREWVNAAQRPSEINKAYGYMWWTNKDLRFKSLPESSYFALGFGGNYIIVDNEHDLVIVCRWMNGTKIDEFLDLLMRALPKK
ncbi:MAG TPA: serine hydrolase [Chryseosolibacter sp.]|nr:serine hydrolase [Chryseosolibacter sp.]